MMKKQLLLFVMALLPMVAMADAVEIDGIYYNLVSKTKTAEVTINPNKYSGNIVIPASVTYGGSNYDVTSIGKDAFYYSQNLTSVTIPNSIVFIGSSAFSMSGLSSVTIPNSVTSIGECAFANCTNLASVSLPNSITSIGQAAFMNCALSSVVIPNSITSIEGLVFSSCSSLTSVTIPSSVTTIGASAFYECSSLLSVAIPNSVIIIGNEAFEGCTRLRSLTIPNSVTTIGKWAFQNCTSLVSINLGNGVTNIYSKAFAACPNLEDVYCYAENVPTAQSNAFEGSYIENATLHVPDASLAAYSNTAPWSLFGTKVGMSGSTQTQKCAKPAITYQNGLLKISCATEDVQFVTEITDADIKKHYDATIELTATYNISVYATKSGYENSDVATVILCWIDQAPSITTGSLQVPANAVLIQSNREQLTVEGLDDGQQVNVYSINGTEAGSAVSRNGQATVNTNLQPGSVVIVKIGEKSVKVVVK